MQTNQIQTTKEENARSKSNKHQKQKTNFRNAVILCKVRKIKNKQMFIKSTRARAMRPDQPSPAEIKSNEKV